MGCLSTTHAHDARFDGCTGPSLPWQSCCWFCQHRTAGCIWCCCVQVLERLLSELSTLQAAGKSCAGPVTDQLELSKLDTLMAQVRSAHTHTHTRERIHTHAHATAQVDYHHWLELWLDVPVLASRLRAGAELALASSAVSGGVLATFMHATVP